MRIVVIALLILFIGCQRQSTPYGGVTEDKKSSPEYTYTPDINKPAENVK